MRHDRSLAGKRPSFQVLNQTRHARARLGVVRTAYGTIRTPSYVIVATNAHIRTLRPSDIKKTGTQIVIANTYHLWNEERVHRTLGVRLPMMTDSGGFQVFSFGAAKDHGVGKVLKQPVKRGFGVSKVKITEKGVHFEVEKSRRFLSPELSMQIQERLGADIIFAFDECTSPLHPLPYTKRAMERTHRWAQRCLAAHTKKDQALFGIVQGGRFKSLRTTSAKALASMPFDGYGIGGSFGKNEMRKTLTWVVPHLPADKPRHLLGIGAVTDIFDAVEAGIDTFDCVIPTREARHGRMYFDDGTRNTRIKTLDAARLATIHNVTWFNGLMKRIRTALADGSYPMFKKQFLTRFLQRGGGVARRTRKYTKSPKSRAY